MEIPLTSGGQSPRRLAVEIRVTSFPGATFPLVDFNIERTYPQAPFQAPVFLYVLIVFMCSCVPPVENSSKPFRSRARWFSSATFPLAAATFPLSTATFPLSGATFPLAAATFPLADFNAK